MAFAFSDCPSDLTFQVPILNLRSAALALTRENHAESGRGKRIEGVKPLYAPALRPSVTLARGHNVTSTSTIVHSPPYSIPFDPPVLRDHKHSVSPCPIRLKPPSQHTSILPSLPSLYPPESVPSAIPVVL